MKMEENIQARVNYIKICDKIEILFFLPHSKLRNFINRNYFNIYTGSCFARIFTLVFKQNYI